MSKLDDRDYILLIDKSGSMSMPGTHSKSRWEEAKEMTGALARKCAEFDPDGITIVVFGNTCKTYPNTTPDKVDQVFKENEPSGGTNTALALTEAFAQRTDKPITVVVVTDGEPNDRNAVKKVIRDYAATLTDNGSGDTDDCGILFMQVGDDKSAADFLRELDDDLKAKFDIVDFKTADELEGMTLADALLAALED